MMAFIRYSAIPAVIVAMAVAAMVFLHAAAVTPPPADKGMQDRSIISRGTLI